MLTASSIFFGIFALTRQSLMPNLLFMEKLQIIRDELERRKGDIRKISAATGLSYDTVLRIKNGEGEPGFKKVEILAEYLGVNLFCNQDRPI